MLEKVEELISASAISKRIEEIAEQISDEYEGKEIAMLCILKGGVIFMVDLARAIRNSVTLDFISLSSYGDAMKSSEEIKITSNYIGDFEGKDVIVVEDIVDTGRTLKFLTDHLKGYNAKSVKVCSLLDKPEQRVVDIEVDYLGFSIPNEFVVGYGLDYAQKYRNLPYIGVLQLDDSQ